jgi:hypothetical protein
MQESVHLGTIVALLLLGACSRVPAEREDPSVAGRPRSTAASSSASPPPLPPKETPLPEASVPAAAPTLKLTVPESTHDASKFQDDVEAWGITTEGLPAISEDGKIIAAVAADIGDGIRDYPSTSLFLVSVAGDTIDKKLPLLRSQEHRFFENLPLDEIIKRSRARVAGAQALLASRAWTPLASAGEEGQANPSLHVNGLDVTLSLSRFRVTRGTRVLLERDVRSWTTPGHAGPVGGQPCRYEARMRSIATDPRERALLVEVTQYATSGGDDCIHPVNALHAFRLPGPE